MIRISVLVRHRFAALARVERIASGRLGASIPKFGQNEAARKCDATATSRTLSPGGWPKTSLMEGDAIVGRMLDALDELNLARDTTVVFASDNGPDGPGVRAFGRRHAGHSLIPAYSRCARRRERRLDPHRRHHPLAGSDPTAILLRHVLDHGFFSRPSRGLLAARCRTTARSTASTRATC